MADFINTYWWIPVLAAMIVVWVTSARRSQLKTQRLAAVAAICDQRGMWRIDNPGHPFLPQMLPMVAPDVRYAFANGDWSLWFAEVRDGNGGDVFALLMFSIERLNLPYVAVGRKGAVDLPLVGRGQVVQLESIDFTDRFAIRADDPRAAVMLVDQGMMQWLLDLDRISFQITGPLLTAIVRENRTPASPVADLQLLLNFCDGLAAHIPELAFSEYAAPEGLAAAAVQAMRTATNLLTNQT